MAVIYTVADLVPCTTVYNCKDHSNQHYILIFNTFVEYRMQEKPMSLSRGAGIPIITCAWFDNMTNSVKKKTSALSFLLSFFPPVFILLISCDLSIVGNLNHHPNKPEEKKEKTFLQLCYKQICMSQFSKLWF